jgi:hypothetical protein
MKLKMDLKLVWRGRDASQDSDCSDPRDVWNTEQFLNVGHFIWFLVINCMRLQCRLHEFGCF